MRKYRAAFRCVWLRSYFDADDFTMQQLELPDSSVPSQPVVTYMIGSWSQKDLAPVCRVISSKLSGSKFDSFFGAMPQGSSGLKD
jgi:hypothetical protein